MTSGTLKCARAGRRVRVQLFTVCARVCAALVPRRGCLASCMPRQGAFPARTLQAAAEGRIEDGAKGVVTTARRAPSVAPERSASRARGTPPAMYAFSQGRHCLVRPLSSALSSSRTGCAWREHEEGARCVRGHTPQLDKMAGEGRAGARRTILIFFICA
eukprot:scaffold1782_cov414-Prasinococcus_capsulatus_cf.AAC.28